MTADPSVFVQAERQLSRRDPVLKKLIKSVGPCTLQPNPDRFGVLVRSIVSQQISTKAAASILARLQQTLKPAGFKPAKILRTPEPALRAAGLSGGETRGTYGPAGKGHAGRAPLPTPAARAAGAGIGSAASRWRGGRLRAPVGRMCRRGAP